MQQRFKYRPSHVLNDLQWWVDNIEHIRRPISHGTPCYIMQTDASTLGWGAHLQGKRTGGQWTEEEAKAHINCLEMKAVLLALPFPQPCQEHMCG